MKYDLFSKPLTEKEKLYIWCKTREFVKTSDIFRYAVENYSNRAPRNARELCKEGKLIRLDDEEKILRRQFEDRLRKDPVFRRALLCDALRQGVIKGL